jgi:hypothetical protein
MAMWLSAGLIRAPAIVLGIAFGAIVLAVYPAVAGTLSGGAGIDYQTGPKAQSYRGALLFASADRAPGDVTIAAVRYKDSLVGAGLAGFANAGLSVASALRLRVIGLRSFGDHGFDAWRLRAGPELRVAPDVTLGAYYLRLHDDAPESFGAAGVELSGPVLRNLSGQIGSSYGRWNGGATTVQGTISGTLRAGSRLSILCEVDAGRNVVTTSTASTSGGGFLGGLPILGGGSSEEESKTDRTITATGQLGVRFLVP